MTRGLASADPVGGSPGAAAEEPERSWRDRLPDINDVSLLLIWAILILLFGLLRPETFLTSLTFKTVAADQAITAIMALSLLLPLAAGIFDLSIGGVMGICVVLVCWFQSSLGMAVVPAIALTLASGFLIGGINAFVIVRLRVDSFIATLGMQSILLAAIQWISGGQQITTGIGEGFKKLGSTALFGITLPFWYMIVVALVLWYVMTYRQTGRYLYAIGSNREGARLAGVRTDRLTVISLLTCSTVAALAGVVFAAKIGSASLEAGPPYLLPAFAAAFLGATQFRARQFNVLGTLIAVYVLATGVKGLQLIGAPFWVNDLFNGVALIIAVAFAVRRAEGAGRSLRERLRRGDGAQGSEQSAVVEGNG
ncbi:MAG: ribose transport system permease protein [Solirubrobacterales bacterium]|nr:ribose transport system permease protein [Solirubrobacterales bacterium]